MKKGLLYLGSKINKDDPSIKVYSFKNYSLAFGYP